MREQANALFRAVNVDGAVGLARAAREARVRRFILASSTTIYGDRSGRAAFGESSPPAPATPYARSKLDGERAVAEALAGSGTDAGRVAAAPGLRSRGEGKLRASGPPGRARPPAADRVGSQSAQSAFRRQPGRCDRARARSPGGGEPDVQRGRSARRLDARACLRDRRGARPSPPLTGPVRSESCALSAALAGRGEELSRLVDDMAVDASRIRAELDWEPPFTLEQGLARSIAGRRRRDEGTG